MGHLASSDATVASPPQKEVETSEKMHINEVRNLWKKRGQRIVLAPSLATQKTENL